MPDTRKKDFRFAIAITLFIASIAASLVITLASQRSSTYWIALHPIPAGATISSSDIGKASATLSSRINHYLTTKSSIIGVVTTRRIDSGALLSRSDLDSDVNHSTLQNIAISLKASDIPNDCGIGDIVTLFQVHDVREGEQEIAPVEVARHLFISQITRNGANFGSDVIVTITVPKEEVAIILQSTGSGRLVIVGTHG